MSEEIEPEKSLKISLDDLREEISEGIAFDALRQSRIRRSSLSAEERLLKALYGKEREEELWESMLEDIPELETKGRIRFEMADGCTIQDFSSILSEFNSAYSSIRFFLRRLSGNNQSLRELLNFPDANTLPTIAQPTLGSASFNSPGFWEAIANWNPLKLLCDYLCQRHERKKDIDYRNSIERELAELEILSKRNKVISAQIETLKKAGFSDDEVKELLSKYISNSLENLGKRIDSGQITAVYVSEENRD